MEPGLLAYLLTLLVLKIIIEDFDEDGHRTIVGYLRGLDHISPDHWLFASFELHWLIRKFVNKFHLFDNSRFLRLLSTSKIPVLLGDGFAKYQMVITS